MINHIRTLLLNCDATTSPGPGFPGEEYVPDGYRARTLPPGVAACYQAAFGNAPDRLYLNYRLWQLLQLLHKTELVEYVLEPDPRVTYVREQDTAFLNLFGLTIGSFDGEATDLLTRGSVACDEGRGICQQIWRVARAGGDLTATRRTPPGPTSVTPLSFANGLSDPVALPGSQLYVSIRDTGDATWTVTSWARPAQTTGDVLSRFLQAVGGHEQDLFGTVTVTPFTELRSVYERHPLTTYKAGAALLALAYRIDTLPRRGV